MKEDKQSLLLQSMNRDLIEYQSLMKLTLKQRALRLRRQLRTLITCVKNQEYHYIANKMRRKNIRNRSEYISGEYDDAAVTSRIAIYTCIFGGYDSVKEPMYRNSVCDYYVYTDSEVCEDSMWEKMDIPEDARKMKLNNQSLARYIKTHPHVLFPEYDYSIFMDGNLQIIADLFPLVAHLGDRFIGIHDQIGCDCLYEEGHNVIALRKAIKEQVCKQMNQYRNEGFPAHYGLFQTNVLVRKHNDTRCITLMESWWEEQLKHTKRDQLSLTYVLWKQGYGYDDVMCLGPDARRNPRFRFFQHA